MPTADQILDGLQEIANTWKNVSIFWHIYFGLLILALVIGIRPSKRTAGILLGLPFLSVSAFAWLLPNPVNGTIFAIVGIVLLLGAIKLPRDNVQIAPLWFLIPGTLLVAFGLVYPHFLDTTSYLSYLFMAPVGLIPCPTLILAIGFILILDGLDSRKYGTILGVVGLLYGIMGITYLHIRFDWVLILSVTMILIYTFSRKWHHRTFFRSPGLFDQW